MNGDGEDQERILHQLINKISMEESARFMSSEFKLKTSSFSAHEALPHVYNEQV